jgi:UDP-N-acetylglucosamine--N-acetylmuramyl-(pentapeptide) pyrophosphoryl-undecaprenol N-acetylglucosamine transferase
MTIVVTGGGSGGHITPILAVAAELKQLDKSIRIVYIGQTGDKLADIPAADPHIDEVFTVRAGKFRRYHGEGWRQLLDIDTQLKNVRDAILVLIGLWQSFWLVRRLQPQVIFSRGGFVSVPVSLGGWLNHVPYITHDSDSMPSLANRLIARWAHLHAVALPAEVYPYPATKTHVVGIPVSQQYELVTARLMRHYRKLLHIDGYKQVLLVTGGGNGAQALNKHVIDNAAVLLKQYPQLVILHIAGRSLVDATSVAYDEAIGREDRKRVIVEGFVTDMYRYSGAADVIIARGGATNLAEFAIQAKACIVIPSPQLAWNVQNARVMAAHEAIVELSEAHAEQEQRLARAVGDLFDHADKRLRLARNLHKLAHDGSARELAELVAEAGGYDL